MFLVRDRTTRELYSVHPVDEYGFIRDSLTLQRFCEGNDKPNPSVYLVDLRDRVVEMSKEDVKLNFEVL